MKTSYALLSIMILIDAPSKPIVTICFFFKKNAVSSRLKGYDYICFNTALVLWMHLKDLGENPRLTVDEGYIKCLESISY